MFTQQLQAQPPNTLKTPGETVMDGGAGRERGGERDLLMRIKTEAGRELGLEVGAKSVRD